MASIFSRFKTFNEARRRIRRELKWSLKHAYARMRRTILGRRTTFVGITGSAGKTTTTDLAAAVLSVAGPCHQTKEFNAEMFVVKTIMETRWQHRFCVAELSARGPGTLDRKVWTFRPDISVITVVGRDHISAYESVEQIAEEKGKVVTALPPDGVAVLNIDDPLVRAVGEGCGRRVVWFGGAEGATLRLVGARSVWPEPLTLQVEYEGACHEVRTRLHGTHMAVPVLAALGVGVAAGVPLERALTALAAVQPPEGRMQAADGGNGVWFVRDDWKAPGWSFPIALEFLKAADARRKVAIVGTISDTTGNSTKEYKKFCKKAREAADLVVFVGSHAHRGLRARREEDGESVQGFSSIRQAAAYLQQELREGDLVLLKGSNKEDHLVRLLLNRSSPVQCWRDHCEETHFCDVCPKLHVPSADVSSAPAVAPRREGAVPVFVGLGNPGAEYQNTAHNVGHRVLDALVQDSGGAWTEAPEGWTSSIDLDGVTVRLLKPAAAMNQNGGAVRCFLDRVGGLPEHCTLVHDDADL